MKQKKKRLTRGLLVLAVILLGISSWLLYNEHSALRDSGAQSDLKPAEDGSRVLDFAALQAEYPDIVAWLTIDGTVIDYPLVQAADNAYYLGRTAQGKENKLGALFLDYRCRRDLSGFNTVVYGHYLRSGAMFSDLAKFKEKAYFESHASGTLYTPQGTYPLKIFAVTIADASSDFYDYAFESPARCQAHLDMIRKKAMHNRDVGVTCDDRLLTLSTCSYEFKTARTLVIAKIAQ